MHCRPAPGNPLHPALARHASDSPAVFLQVPGYGAHENMQSAGAAWARDMPGGPARAPKGAFRRPAMRAARAQVLHHGAPEGNELWEYDGWAPGFAHGGIYHEHAPDTTWVRARRRHQPPSHARALACVGAPPFHFAPAGSAMGLPSRPCPGGRRRPACTASTPVAAPCARGRPARRTRRSQVPAPAGRRRAGSV